MKAIETHYNGYRFRSRLEARWAVFLEAIGVPYVYEAQGFDLEGTPYLPDFWLPIHQPTHAGAGFWLEIKPVELAHEEACLLMLLTKHTGHNALCFQGNIGVGEFAVTKFFCDRELRQPCCFPFTFVAGGSPGSQYGAYHASHWPYGISHLFECCPPGGLKRTFEQGFALARSARFEHGESPTFR